MSHHHLTRLGHTPLLFFLDVQGLILNCEDDAGDYLGYAQADLCGKNLLHILRQINPEWEAQLAEWPQLDTPLILPASASAASQTYYYNLHAIPSAEGYMVSLSLTLPPQAETSEETIDELLHDTHALRQIMLRLRMAESRLELYHMHFPGIVYTQRVDFSFSYIAPAITSLLGPVALDTFRSGNAFLETILESDREQFLKQIESHGIQEKPYTLTYRLRHPQDGSVLYLMDVRMPRQAPSGLLLGYDGIWLDITRQAIAEKRLSQTAWKENLATLTSGLVHDFSNIMAGIYSLSELYFSSVAEEHPWHRGLHQIMDSSKEARKLVRRIIDLNREETGHASYHNLERLIKDQLDLIQCILPKQTVLKTDFTEQEWPVYMDDVAFRQMFLNLAMNSADALQQEGEISIRVRPAKANELIMSDSLDGPWAPPRDGILIEFSDNGSGIPRHIQSKIFDPFFTTKEASKGTGFGLYNAHLFINSCHGRLSVQSQPGEGTTFYIYLPQADFTEEQDMVEEVKAPVPPQQRTRVALYHSRESNTELADYLCEKEYEVLNFCEPDKLHRILREAAFRPHLIVLLRLGDDTMADALWQDLHQAYPDICALYIITGQNTDHLPETLRRDDNVLIAESLQLQSIVAEVEERLQGALTNPQT